MKDKIKELKNVKDTVISSLKEGVNKLITEWNDWLLRFPYDK